MPPGNVDAESVKRKLRFDYLKVRNEPPSKVLDVFSNVLAHYYRPNLVIHDLIQDTANQIQRGFRLRWVMIGLKNESDGMYHYEVHSGMRPEAWANQKTRVYKLESFDVYGDYKAGEISKLTRVLLEEENPLDKASAGVTNRPILLGSRRKNEMETLEADFIDTLIYGPNNDLLGWIEYSGTVTGHFPEAMTIRNIEIVANLLGVGLYMHGKHRPGVSP
jgi:hypothetical protein